MRTFWQHSQTITAPLVHQRVPEPLMNWPSFQHKPNLIGPLVEGEWAVEAEAMPTILTES